MDVDAARERADVVRQRMQERCMAGLYYLVASVVSCDCQERKSCLSVQTAGW